jgi:hypothetical protein
MTNVMIIGSNPSLIIGTIGAQGTLSEQLDLASYNSFGLLTDNAVNGTINIWVSNQLAAVPSGAGTLADNYRLLRDNVGAAYALTLPTGSSAFKASDIAVIAPYRFVRFSTSVGQANGTGASATTFTLVVKG